jgi:hypothetical protein
MQRRTSAFVMIDSHSSGQDTHSMQRAAPNPGGCSMPDPMPTFFHRD